MIAELQSNELTTEEIQDFLVSLSTGDLLRLAEKAHARALGSGMSPDDLLQEAIRRALQGKRICPRNVSVDVFLQNVMRSIASEERKQWKRDRPLGLDLDENNPILQEQDPSLSPEDVTVDGRFYQDVINKIEKMFDDDPKALAVVMGDMEGFTPDETREIEPMTDKEYAAARKRVRRALLRAFPKGYDNE